MGRSIKSLVLILFACAVVPASPARALGGDPRPRVQLEVALAGAPAPGSDGLGYFVPEVARSVAETLRRGGVAVATADELGVSSGAATASSLTPVSIALEERVGDRVAIAARARGRRVEVEGAVERIDALIEELIEKLLPICLDGSGGAQAVASTTASPLGKPRGTSGRPTVVTTPSPPAATLTTTTTPAAPTPTTTASTTTSAPTTAMSSSVTPVTAPTPTAPNPAPATTASTSAPPPLTPIPSPPPTLVTPTPPAAVPPASKTPAPLDPYGPDARVSDPSPTPLGNSTPGERAYVRGRVVVHTIPEPAGGYVGAGTIATQAFYAVLQRRLRFSVVPMGVGISSLASALDEGQRAQAHVVVMARVDGLTLSADPGASVAGAQGAMTARMRLEVAVVRDGHISMRRTIVAETPPVADARRGQRVDPVYLAVTHALDGVIGELAIALGPSAGTNAGDPR